MQTLTDLPVNTLPTVDMSDIPTGCCPRFDPDTWRDTALHFDNMPFVHVSTLSFMHLPLNMSSTFSATFEAIRSAHARARGYLVLTHHRSAWHDDHLFAVDRPVEGADMTYVSGTFHTRIFEGPYGDVPRWHDQLISEMTAAGRSVQDVYWFYTTCPKCAKAYGANFVVGLAQVEP